MNVISKILLIVAVLFSELSLGQTANFNLQVTGLPTGYTCTSSASGMTINIGCVLNSVPGPTIPTGCVAAVSNNALASNGGQVNLSVNNCNPSTVTYSWLKNGAVANSNQNWTDNLSANIAVTATTTSYQVQVCNGSACAVFPQNPLTVTVAGVTVTPPITPWNATCPGFDETHLVTLRSGSFGRQVVKMKPNDAIVVEFTTGSRTTADTIGFPSSIGIADYASIQSDRIARLSSKPCDFSTQPAWGANADNIITVSFYYIVGAGNTYGGYYPLLQPNTKYYVNFKNSPNTSCFSTGVCDVFVEPSNLIPE